MYKLTVFALLAVVSCNDLIQGPEGGRKVYDENKEASPAIWKQKNEVTIKANDTEIISRINITDLRPDKDGEVRIIEGGQGQKNVTIELKSPTILRGYDFHIEVYVIEDNGQQTYPESLYPEEVTEQIPVMENDTQVNPTKSEESVTPKETDPVSENITEIKDKVEAPIITDRKSRNTDVTVDPIVQYVSENITGTGKDVKDKMMPLKSYSQLLSTNPQHEETKKHGDKPNETKTVGAVTTHDAPLKPHPLKEEEFRRLKTNVYKHQAATTEESTTVDAESVTESRNLNPFSDISEELGQHVVFGIKKV